MISCLTGISQTTGTFKDSRDGKVYKTVKIGTQAWLAENLAYKADSGCWAYNNISANAAKYGYLYNWEIAENVCPAGWHLPSHDEWNTLKEYVGGQSVAGGKLKSTKEWKSPNTGATNEIGFTALPGGGRDSEGKFIGINETGIWWSSAVVRTGDGLGVVIRILDYNSEGENERVGKKSSSVSVRCIKD